MAEVVHKAVEVFWQKGFAATTTDELLEQMGIGRQSFYNAFGGKRELYLEVLKAYHARAAQEHLSRLNGMSSPIAGLRQLLRGLAVQDDRVRGLGCLGVASAAEFGTTDPEVLEHAKPIQEQLESGLVRRIREGQEVGEIALTMSPEMAAAFVQMVMTGLQIAARSGANVQKMQDMADFAIDRLRAG